MFSSDLEAQKSGLVAHAALRFASGHIVRQFVADGRVHGGLGVLCESPFVQSVGVFHGAWATGFLP